MKRPYEEICVFRHQPFRLPDLYFANARQAHFHYVTIPNFNMFISQDGTIAYSCR